MSAFLCFLCDTIRAHFNDGSNNLDVLQLSALAFSVLRRVSDLDSFASGVLKLASRVHHPWVISTSFGCFTASVLLVSLVLGTTGFIVSVRSSHLCLRRIFGFITVRSSRLWLHHDSSDIINITLRSAQLYRRPSFNVVVIQRGDAR